MLLAFVDILRYLLHLRLCSDQDIFGVLRLRHVDRERAMGLRWFGRRFFSLAPMQARSVVQGLLVKFQLFKFNLET